MTKFYDTCSLLDLQSDAFKEKFMISNITLSELEEIKNSKDKDEEIKYAAKKLLHLLENNSDKYKVVLYNTSFDDIIKFHGLIMNNDSRIIATVYHQQQILNDIVFYTGDLSCKKNAEGVGLIAVYTNGVGEDPYRGYKVIDMDDEKLNTFYNSIIPENKNVYELLVNEYLLIIYDGKFVDQYRWTGEHYEQVNFSSLDSKMFGKIIPKDKKQLLAIHSLKNNQITMLRGHAGTGKSYLAFGHMFELLEQGKIDKIIIFCNTVATKGSAKLGFYPGSRTEKLLDSQIGNLLESKLGDRSAVEKLIDDGLLVLLPMSDIRGYDTTGMKAAIYISEAQNLDIELMRLALQRIGEDSICILDGDSDAQVDLSMYAGTRNGMRRVSTVFRGADFYGEITLDKIYRSKIAELAQKL